MLPRWRHIIEMELPELLGVLTAWGATRINALHLLPRSATGGWQAGDEQFDTLGARRPMLEAALAHVAGSTPGLRIRRGVKVTGLITTVGAGHIPHVVGVRTATKTLRADLVVDAAGRRTPVPGWLRAIGTGPVEERGDDPIVYYTRYYRSTDGRLPQSEAAVATDHESFGVLTTPADNGTWAVGLATHSHDKKLRALRDNQVWEAAVGSLSYAVQWLNGRPITDVTPIAGLQDIRRRYVVSGTPVVCGLTAVGDAWAVTNPSLGRGSTIGAMHACALRDVLATIGVTEPVEAALRLDAAAEERVGPIVEGTITYGQRRSAEMAAEMGGAAYQPDSRWAMTTALLNGALADPVLARASTRVGTLLATPMEVLSDPEVQARLRPLLAGPRHPAGHADRADLLRAMHRADLAPARPPRR